MATFPLVEDIQQIADLTAKVFVTQGLGPLLSSPMMSPSAVESSSLIG
jgi:hypothetical protein